MPKSLQPLLDGLDDRSLLPALAGGSRGIEKESLRVDPDGSLATTPHPRALGSTLTHPNITTDFSESQLELITGVHGSVPACLDELAAVHRFVYAKLGDETLWSASMPCVLAEDRNIPLATFGSSNVGMAKHIYRRGLGNRFGRAMQTISGIHYNYSFAEPLWRWYRDTLQPGADLETAKSIGYFGLIRNFRRYAWLLLYLFGASPALCHTFLGGRPHTLEQRGSGTLFRPDATSLRMGDLGYQSNAQAQLHVSYNDLDSYASTLFGALTTPYPDYERIGVLVDGEYRQLNANLLQIENEFYGTIRPKRTIMPGERPLHALDERGVEYVEVRCLDVNPFLPMGIDANTLYFLDVFLTWCLLHDSPMDSPEESAAMAANQRLVVDRGREAGLELSLPGQTRRLGDWGAAILDDCAAIAGAMDTGLPGNARPHADSVALQRNRLANAALTPSARILEALPAHDESFYRFAKAASDQHRAAALADPLPPERLAAFDRLSAESLAKQAEIEAADTLPFDRYLEAYLDPARLRVPAARRRDRVEA